MMSTLFPPPASANEPKPIEPSAETAFTGNRLIRDSEHRGEDAVPEALRTDGAHCFAFCGNRLVLKHDGLTLDPLFLPYEMAELAPDFDAAILLGHTPAGEPRLAVPVGLPAEALEQHYAVIDGRTLFREGHLTGEILGEFAQAASLVAWNAVHRHCGRCGGAMEMRAGGYKRECTACGHLAFPRTDPVVIMLAVDERQDRCLLGRSPHFPPGMYSALAGFLEPGETIEEAVRRETLEESGIRIGRVRYHASQPWPMPHTLMIGCYGEALTAEVRRDERELEDCRWFSRDEVRAMLSDSAEAGEGAARAPHDGTIAHRLLCDWLLGRV